MLSSPRSPSRTMRIFSSAENFRRVMRRISFTTFSAGSFTGPDFRLIFAPRKATMSQKSSFLQSVQSVSQALTSDSQRPRALSLSEIKFEHRDGVSRRELGSHG